MQALVFLSMVIFTSITPCPLNIVGTNFMLKCSSPLDIILWVQNDKPPHPVYCEKQIEGNYLIPRISILLFTVASFCRGTPPPPVDILVSDRKQNEWKHERRGIDISTRRAVWSCPNYYCMLASYFSSNSAVCQSTTIPTYHPSA